MWWLLVLVVGLVAGVALADLRVRRYQRDIEVELRRSNREAPGFNPPPIHDRAGPH